MKNSSLERPATLISAERSVPFQTYNVPTGIKLPLQATPTNEDERQPENAIPLHRYSP